MIQKKPRDHFHIIVTFLCVVFAIAFTAIVYSYQLDNAQNQLIDAKAPNLVNVSLGYSDNGQGVLHITGYVFNSGSEIAYKSQIQVDLYNGSTKTNSTSLYIGKDSSDQYWGANIEGKTAYYVDENVTYNGNPPTNVTFTLGWKTAWDLRPQLA
jgi:hypothetical protein